MSGLIFFPFNSQGADFERLLAPYMDALYRLAYRFTGQRQDAEDLVQELLLRLYARRKQLHQVEELKPWLARSLYNLYIDTLRQRQRSPLGRTDSDSEPHLSLMVDPAPQPDNQAELSETEKRLVAALDTLNESHRSLIILHDMEGYTLKELAQIFAIPTGTLKSRLHRARRNLRDQLDWEPFGPQQRVTG